MNKKSFEVVEFDGEIDEMLNHEGKDIGESIIKGFEEGIKTQLSNQRASLSDFAREVKGGNRKERRAEAKRIRKAF